AAGATPRGATETRNTFAPTRSSPRHPCSTATWSLASQERLCLGHLRPLRVGGCRHPHQPDVVALRRLPVTGQLGGAPGSVKRLEARGGELERRLVFAHGLRRLAEVHQQV